MALNFAGRAYKLATGLYTAAKGAGKFAEKAVTSNTAKKASQMVGNTFNAGWHGFWYSANEAWKGAGKLKDVNWKGIGAKIGKHADMAGGAALTDLFGVDNALGMATGGINIKPLNNGLNKLLNTNKFTDRRWGALVKDNPDALLFGKSFTKLGAVAAIGIGGAVATKDAVQNHMRSRAGVNTGLVSNAPVNTYAGDQTFPTMGASYANNAGATGDLALSLHRQRHTGIL